MKTFLRATVGGRSVKRGYSADNSGDPGVVSVRLSAFKKEQLFSVQKGKKETFLDVKL